MGQSAVLHIDRTFCVQPNQVVKTDWIDIDCCILGNRTQMAPESVEKKFRLLLCQGLAQCWPGILGRWQGERFVVCDGRHEYLASLMLGREKVFVAWLENQ